jgi:hypothetical protein
MKRTTLTLAAIGALALSGCGSGDSLPKDPQAALVDSFKERFVDSSGNAEDPEMHPEVVNVKLNEGNSAFHVIIEFRNGAASEYDGTLDQGSGKYEATVAKITDTDGSDVEIEEGKPFGGTINPTADKKSEASDSAKSPKKVIYDRYMKRLGTMKALAELGETAAEGDHIGLWCETAEQLGPLVVDSAADLKKLEHYTPSDKQDEYDAMVENQSVMEDRAFQMDATAEAWCE